MSSLSEDTDGNESTESNEKSCEMETDNGNPDVDDEATEPQCEMETDNGNPDVDDNVTEPQNEMSEDGTTYKDDEASEPDVKRKFSFNLKYKTWKKFKMKTNKRGERRLHGSWCNILAKEIMEVNKSCPIVFKKNRVRKLDSRKKNSPFFTANARCKFSECVRYTVKVKNEPIKGEPVKVKVKIEKPYKHVNHDEGIVKGRPITGKARKEIAQLIKEKGPSNVFYKKFGDVDRAAIDAGNSSEYGSKDVMRKISSESNLANRLHSDVIVEVSLLKKVYEREDETKGSIKGSIQAISMSPFSVMLYNNDQLSLLAQHICSDDSTLYFDSTGRVISNIPTQPKRVFYYPLILKGLEPGDPPVPVAEFISNSHKAVDVTTFLLRLDKDLHDSYPSVGVPERIEVDYSWSLIHGVLLGFNRENIHTYLQRAWDTIHGKQDWGSNCKVHLCSAHVLHAISTRLGRRVTHPTARKYLKYVIARIVDADNLADIDEAFRNLCVVLLSKTVESHPSHRNALSFLDDLVDKAEPRKTKDYEDDGDNDNDDSIVEEDEEFATGKKPSLSVFGTHFRRIKSDVQSFIIDDNGPDANPYYSPDVVNYFISMYMCILPLWTGILLGGSKTHDTNSPVENWNKIIKSDILQDQQRMTPSNFIIEVHTCLKGRVREYQLKSKGLLRLKRKKKQKKSLPKNSFSKAEERWGGRKKAKKGIYFSPPPQAFKDKVTALSNRKKKKLKLTTTEGNALHWGGTADFGGKVIHLSNTCPVDNLLVIMHKLLMKSSIRDWFSLHQDDIKVCQVLLEVSDLFSSGNWTEGRVIWLRNFFPVPDDDTWNVWGSEADRFVRHFGDIQRTTCSYSCSKRKCPSVRREVTSMEILLGDHNADSEMCSLEESLRQWEEATTLPCQTDTAYGRCKGNQMCTEREFVYGTPPVLIMSASFLSLSKQLTPDRLPAQLLLKGRRYNLAAYTLGVVGHFKAYLVIDGQWNRYDGLRRPEIARVAKRGSEGRLEHVVYALDC